MKFNVIDTENIYRRLLDTPDAASRAVMFNDELVAPFSGLAKVFGMDGQTAFKMWGMAPDLFGGDHRDKLRATIETMAAANAWGRAAEALAEGAAAFAKYADRIPQNPITFGLMLADMSAAPWSKGYTGFGAIPGWVMTVYGEPSEYNLARVKPATAHELHHNIFGAVFPNKPMIATVGEYMIGEGLAESFAAELYGAELTGPWVTDFDEARLEETRRLFADALHITGFDEVRKYIFGDVMADFMNWPKTGIAPLAGYAIGYRVVQAYLQRTGKSVVETTFVPAWEIIEESRFFAGS